MPKYANLGNGSLLIGLDRFGQVKDVYFHYAGLENHVSEGFVHKIGVFVDDKFSWFDDGSWDTSVSLEPDSMVSAISVKNSDLGLELTFSDVVYNEQNIFVREVTVKNNYDRKRKLKIYFNQQFNISQTHIGDTAYYDPREEVIIHYKGRRVFLFNAKVDTEHFSEYSVGLLGIEGKAGTFKDAEDGNLSGNAIEHGQVDSVIGLETEVQAKSQKKLYYFMCVAKSLRKAKELNATALSKFPENILATTRNYWKAWLNNRNFSFYGLDKSIVELFNKSLLTIRTHVSKNGAIIASGDSDLFQFERDTYSYVWPRDAAFSALALEKAGDFNASRRFFEFCSDVVTDSGYFMHKYRPDKSLGSSWHPWVQDGKKQFPIQEDETAIIIYALWKHFELSKDLEFIEGVYNSLIKKAAEFMVGYRDDETGLPAASYDLWEMVYGISTYTSSAVYGSLMAASKFAKLLGKTESEKKYLTAAQDIKKAILKYLYDTKTGAFIKQLSIGKKRLEPDSTLDMSSVYGVFRFEVLDRDDAKLKKAFDIAVDRLKVDTQVGGVARFEGDVYRHRGGDVPGNPWVNTTMWYAQYQIAQAKKETDMESVKKWLGWAVKYAGNAGVLPEQFDPYTGEYVSATPLTWSHAEFVITVIAYLEKLEELGVCKACYPVDN